MILVSSEGHMASTINVKHLHKFAKKLGLDKTLFVPVSTDVPISFYYVKSRKTRTQAIKLGAKLVNGPQFILQILAGEKLHLASMR